MPRNRYKLAGILVAVIVVFVGAIFYVVHATSANAQAVTMHLDYVPGPLKVTSAVIPGTCSTWHELYPVYCTPHHQSGYQDGDGDGQVSPCDNIQLDGNWYHITWVGPTYFLSCGVDSSVYEPTDPGSGGDPTCQSWTEIHPNFGTMWHVDGWSDNGDGVVSVCDGVLIGGLQCHIDRIGLDITVEPGGSTSIEKSTWGTIKSLFRDL